MSTDRTGNDAVFERALARLGPIVTAGLEGWQARWALDSLRDTVLPDRLDFGADVDRETRERWSARVVEDLAFEFEATPKEQRWQRLQVEHWLSRMGQLDDEAFALAQRRYSEADDAATLEARATPVREQLESLGAEMAREAPSAHAHLAAELSEAIMDCVYAQTGAPATSLRLKNWIEDLEASP